MAEFDATDGLPPSEVVRVDLLDRGLREVVGRMGPQITQKAFPDMAGMSTTQDLFIVSGRVVITCYAMTGPNGVIGALPAFGPELIVNGNFTGSADNWVLQAGWLYAADMVDHASDPPSEGFLYQQGSDLPFAAYKLELDASGNTNPGGYLSLQVNGTSFGTHQEGHYNSTQSVDPSPGTPVISVQPLGSFDGAVDNFSLKATSIPTISIGTDDLPLYWNSRSQDIYTLPLPGFGLWSRTRVFLPDDEDPIFPEYHYVSDVTVRLFLGGPIDQGSMIVYAQWYPLEPGATVTVAQ